MIAIAVDDERWALDDLTTILNEQAVIKETHAFLKAQEALDWCSGNKFDIAFLDISMRGIDGIKLAKKLREINRRCYIIFCTGFDDHAMDAIELHCNGYLLKPILPEKVSKELSYIASFDESEKQIRVRCYGGFEVFDMKGQPIKFKRKRAKELLAALVDKNGIGLSSKELASKLFEDDGSLDTKNQNHVYKLVQELNRALNEVGANEVLKKNGYNYYVDMSKVEIDETGKGELEYMPDYSW